MKKLIAALVGGIVLTSFISKQQEPDRTLVMDSYTDGWYAGIKAMSELQDLCKNRVMNKERVGTLMDNLYSRDTSLYGLKVDKYIEIINGIYHKK